jgi:hypothetical protein
MVPGSGNSSLVSLTGSAGGTITFNSGYTYSGVYISLQDGNQTPNWAIFYLGTVDATSGYSFDWAYLTCNPQSKPCSTTSLTDTTVWQIANGAISGIDIWWASATQIVATPLPGALPLFAAGIGLIGFAARRKRRIARLSA